MTHVIAAPCIDCKNGACLRACPTDAIHPRLDEPDWNTPMRYIDPATCTDCGACEPACPVTAIFPIDELPPRWSSFVEVNADWYRRG